MMPDTTGCDLLADLTPTASPIAIPFGFDYVCDVAFVANGQTVWTNPSGPILLSALIAEEATAEDLAATCRDLAVTLLRRKAERED